MSVLRDAVNCIELKTEFHCYLDESSDGESVLNFLYIYIYIRKY
jgi:hypothetical protein